MNTKRNDQLARTNSPWSVALKVLCAIMAITGSAWPNQAGSIRPDFDTLTAGIFDDNLSLDRKSVV